MGPQSGTPMEISRHAKGWGGRDDSVRVTDDLRQSSGGTEVSSGQPTYCIWGVLVSKFSFQSNWRIRIPTAFMCWKQSAVVMRVLWPPSWGAAGTQELRLIAAQENDSTWAGLPSWIGGVDES